MKYGVFIVPTEYTIAVDELDIAAGKGRGPKPFILAAKHQAPPNAIWNSNKGSAAELRASRGGQEKPVGARQSCRVCGTRGRTLRYGVMEGFRAQTENPKYGAGPSESGVRAS